MKQLDTRPIKARWDSITACITPLLERHNENNADKVSVDAREYVLILQYGDVTCNGMLDRPGKEGYDPIQFSLTRTSEHRSIEPIVDIGDDSAELTPEEIASIVIRKLLSSQSRN